jgi:transposase
MLMSTKTKSASFENQVFHIGIDVHKKDWKVTIRSNAMQLKTFSLNPSPEDLAAYMRRNYPGGEYRSVYEAGFCGYWIHRELTKLDFRNIITNAADVPTTNKEKDRKSDPVDSAKLSRELEHSSLMPVFVPTPEQEALRSLSRLHRQHTKRSVQIKNRIKGFLNTAGYKLPENSEVKHWSGNFITILEEIAFSIETNRFILDEHISELKHIRKKQLLLLREMRHISKDKSVIKLLQTIPGIGLISAFALYTELVDIHRFSSLDHLCGFIGLVPSTHSSGTKEITCGMSNRQNRFLRRIIIEAAWVAVRKDPALTAAYNTLIRRMSKQRAIVRIAKKLTNRIRYVWLHQKEYVTAVVE